MNKPTLIGVIEAPADWGWSVWPPRKPDDGFNVIPDDDIHMHVNGPTCWCKPEEDETDANLWLHRAADGREEIYGGYKRLQ